VAVVLDGLHELGERLAGLEEGEREVVRRQLSLGRQHLGFVVDDREAQTQAHRSSLVITAWQ
jgi:hypothetical protein